MTTKIKATCECGQSLQAKPELAGKRVKCPACGEALVVPKPKVAAEKIRVTCQCGKTLSAKPELAGKRVKCPSCGNPLMMPKPAATKKTSPPPTEQAGDPLGLGDLEDLVQESAQAPQRLKRLPAKDRTVEDAARAKPKKARQTGTGNALDSLTMVAGVACILHGLGGPAVMSRFVWAVVSTAGIGGVFSLLMSLQGFVAVASVVVGMLHCLRSWLYDSAALGWATGLHLGTHLRRSARPGRSRSTSVRVVARPRERNRLSSARCCQAVRTAADRTWVHYLFGKTRLKHVIT